MKTLLKNLFCPPKADKSIWGG